VDYKNYVPRKIRRKIKTKICSKCGKEKSLRNFYYHSRRKYYISHCRTCSDKRVVKYYKINSNNPKIVFQIRSCEIYRKCRVLKLPCMSKLLGRYLVKLWDESKQTCYYTGRKMDLKGYPENPNAVTVDRVIPEKGYVEGNIVLCTSIANRAKQNMKYAQLISFCEEILKNKKRKYLTSLTE